MLALYNKDFTTKYGAINSIIEAFVEEERNGLFELSFVMLNTDSLFKYIEEDNIVVANANNTLINQKFRIYMTRKLMNNRVEVFARHISFDLMYDYIDSVSFENQSCEYGLNQLFRSSQFSSHYKGYSDIINAQNYSMNMANVLEAIGGKKGSLIDTFGTGAELLRDNENIHILNKRGHDNSVSIEYRKNLTGFELEEDTTELVTRILPYARYTPANEEGNSQDEVTVKGSFVDSPLIANYSHPFVKAIDYSDKFEEGEEVTTNKLTSFARNEYEVNNVDKPKQNFKIEFIPLSKCIGFEGLKDNISLCDTVTIKDTRYNINTQAKVIKTTFNVLKNRYESMELGEPRTSLGDIIGSNDSSKGEEGPPGPQGPPGEDGSVGDFPNTLPSTPVVTTKVYGFANIEISWTFENKVYYQYEVYASKEANFTPNTFNLIHSGQTSTYMYQAKPNETWYFKVCAINTHGDRTDFGNAYATTVKIDDLSNYVDEMAINEALIGTLSLDRGWVGTLKGNYIDAKQLSVTDGNGKRTLDIDSYGNVNLDVTSLKISSSNVATENYADTKATQALNDSKTYTTTQTTVTNNKVASIETNLNGITSRVSSVETKTTTINDTVTNHESRIKTAESKITSDAIINTVSSSYYKKGETDALYATQTQMNAAEEAFIGLDARLNTAEQKITSDAIINTVSSSYYKKGETDALYATQTKMDAAEEAFIGLDNRMNIAESMIIQQADQIQSKVDVNGVVSTATQNAGSIISEFSKTGKVIIRNGNLAIQDPNGGNMLCTEGGRLVASALDLYGTNDGTLRVFGTGNKGVEIRSEDDKMAYLDFSRNASSDYHFRVSCEKNESDILARFTAPQFVFQSQYGGADYTTYVSIIGHLQVTGKIYGDGTLITSYDVGQTLYSMEQIQNEQDEVLVDLATKQALTELNS